MRITQIAKAETKGIILAVAERLFLKKGYENTTTRDIALEAGIATGTLFNYFASKETLAMTMISEAMSRGREDYKKRRTGEEDTSEALFLLIQSELRSIRPFRTFVGPVIESTMSLFAKQKTCQAGETTRIEHLKAVQDIILANGGHKIPEFISLSLYWSLYLGILAYWSNDASRNQEETLVLIDFTMKLFTRMLAGISHDEDKDLS